jgi:hypothetical protein
MKRLQSEKLWFDPFTEDLLQIKLHIEPDHMFRERSGLNHKEPPHILCGKLLVGSSIHCEGGRNVHKANFLDAFGMIETEPVRHTRAAIMSRHQEEIVTLVTHHIGLILRHGAK